MRVLASPTHNWLVVFKRECFNHHIKIYYKIYIILCTRLHHSCRLLSLEHRSTSAAPACKNIGLGLGPSRRAGQLMLLDLSWAFSIHPVLNPKKGVTAGLEDTAELERPWDGRLGGEEPKHLHAVTEQPAGQDGEPETFAGPGLRIGDNLWQRQYSLNSEPDVANQGRIPLVHRRNRGEQELASHQADKQGHYKLPVSAPNVSQRFLYIMIVSRGTHGLGDLHCQKLNGRCLSRSFTLAKGTAASPPFDEGAGRWSSAILRRTTCMTVMTSDCIRRAMSNLAPG